MVVLSRIMFTRCLIVASALVVLCGSPHATPAGQGVTPRVIEITAERFEFWPAEVNVAEGEEVELRIRSDDTMHGFRIVGTNTNLVIPKRGKGYAVGRFTGSSIGRYTFECNRMCGAGHNFMRGELVVRPSPTGKLP
jgi:heme/copper-type cytochrome/quinol oxidase subunit 2